MHTRLRWMMLWTLLGLLAGAGTAAAQAPEDGSWRKVHDLRGAWRFHIGDDPAWASPGLRDGGWEEIFVPAAWEDEGYPGYDGYAWYRRRFRLDAGAKGKYLYLHLGRIDDVDEVYVNGHLVGSEGACPPAHRTAYHLFRIYRLPENVLHYGKENVIAVRVYDERLEGGLLEGQVGIYERLDDLPLVVDLAGAWRFRPGDDPRWRAEKISEAGWHTIQAPARWEPQGFERLDGFAWYRVDFFMPERSRGQALVLLLGLIDDLDEAYVNGVRVGRTGDLERRHVRGDEWKQLRAYPLPEEVLNYGGYNTLAVRVYDGELDGGLYQGPVGVATRAAFERWHGGTAYWKRLLDWVFDGE